MSAETLSAAFRVQAGACAELGSPFTARLCTLAAERLAPGGAVADRLLAWEGDLTPSGDSVPLRFCGALQALVLSGKDPALSACYPPHTVSDEALWQAVSDALETHAAFLDGVLDSPPQTNEVARSAVLIAAGHWLTARLGLPIVLSELGASAGLNLNWDRYAMQLGGQHYGPADAALLLTPEERGGLPPLAAPEVIARRGVDLRPVDLSEPAARLRLRSYVWPDQEQRVARMEQALALPPAAVDAGDAAAWLELRLAETYPGALHLVYHTIAWQYFPAPVKAACSAALETAGARATAEAPLAHFGMESDGGSPGAALTLTLWTGGAPVTTAMGRVDFHGRWLDWQAPDGP